MTIKFYNLIHDKSNMQYMELLSTKFLQSLVTTKQTNEQQPFLEI
jgi:hypothetical protein